MSGEILLRGDMAYAENALKIARDNWGQIRSEATKVGFGWGYWAADLPHVSYFLRKTKRGASVFIQSSHPDASDGTRSDHTEVST